MKRRDFLQTAGLLTAGATHVLGACRASEAQASEARSRRPPADHALKQVLVTSAHRELARVIAAELKDDYQVRLTAPVHVETPGEFVESALDHDERTGLAVQGVDAIVHVAEPPPNTAQLDRIDYRTRCTYNLLQAAVKAGVQAVVYLSSLRVVSGHDERFQVDEDWRPLPAPASGGLSDHLGEYTCREFAREGKLGVIVLRLGKVAPAGAPGEEAPDSARVDPRDVAQAVSRALTRLLAERAASGAYWSIFHVLSQSASSRFPIRKAERILGYRPSFGGQDQ